MKVKTKVKAGTLTVDEDGFIQEPEKWEPAAPASVGTQSTLKK